MSQDSYGRRVKTKTGRITIWHLDRITLWRACCQTRGSKVAWATEIMLVPARPASGFNDDTGLRMPLADGDSASVIDPIEQNFYIIFRKILIDRPAGSLPVTVVVDDKDAAFNKPRKKVFKTVICG